MALIDLIDTRCACGEQGRAREFAPQPIGGPVDLMTEGASWPLRSAQHAARNSGGSAHQAKPGSCPARILSDSSHKKSSMSPIDAPPRPVHTEPEQAHAHS